METGFKQELNKSQGYIKLFRSLKEWEWYDDANAMRVFIHFLLSANHKQAKWRGKLIERGSFITSYRKIASELNIGIQAVRIAIENLKKSKVITHKATRHYSIISINNYDLYQENDTQNNTHDNTQGTNKQHTDNTQGTTNNNEKNIKNDKNKKNIQAKNLFLKFFEDDSELKQYESFKDIFLKWLEYKTAIKKQYKSEQGLKGAFKDLIRLSQNNVNNANELVEYAISKEWQGIYALPKSAKKIQSVSDNQPKTDWESRCM